jgi:hypothetical protein
MGKTILNILFSILILLSSVISLSAQTNGDPAYVPINDLGKDLFQGRQGGLYPNGSNTMPESHQKGFSSQVALIKPLDSNGSPSANGKIAFALVGASSPKIEFPYIEERARSLPNINANLAFVNIGQGGLTYEKLLDASDRYWQNNVPAALKSQNISAQQVQVVWLKSDSLRRDDPLTFPATPEYEKGLIKEIVQKIKLAFPNCQVIYFTARNTTVYVDDSGVENGGIKHAEPRAYFNGWGIKWAIEDQINGDPELAYTGSAAKAPIMVWGFYFWCRGAQPRVSDGYNWLATDVQKDGVHPSPEGAEKVAARFVDNFVNDATTAKWFLNANSSPSTCAQPSWVINGKDKFKKLGRLIAERDNVKATASNESGIFVKDLLDIFNSCHDLNAELGKGRFLLTFYDKNGAEIKLNGDVKYTLVLK